MRQMIEQAMDMMEKARISAHQGMRIKDVLAALDAAPEDAQVMFDFDYMSPSGFNSYRGYYSDLAIDYSEQDAPTVFDFKRDLQECVGKTFMGYKGGDFTMTKETPLWVSKSGNARGTAIVRVSSNSYYTTLHTALIDE